MNSKDTASNIKVLIISRDEYFCSKLIVHMTQDIYFLGAASCESDLADHLKQEIDVALLDLSSLGFHGLNLMGCIKAWQPQAQIVCLLPRGKLKLSIAAMHHGAYAELLFPFSWPSLLQIVKKAYSRKLAIIKGKKGLSSLIEDKIDTENLGSSGGNLVQGLVADK